VAANAGTVRGMTVSKHSGAPFRQRWSAIVARVVLVLAFIAVIAGNIMPSLAAPAAAPQALPIASITNGGATWTTIGKQNFCLTSQAAPYPLNVQDAAFPAAVKSDAYDDAFCMFVGSTPYIGSDTVDLTNNAVTSGPTTMSGLNVTYQFAFIGSVPAVRVLASFQNPTAAPIVVPVTFESNLGSDNATRVIETSSGHAIVSATDRWAITAEGTTDPTLNDPPEIHVVAGPGSPAQIPTTFTAGVNFAGPGCSTVVPGEISGKRVSSSTT
jgi:hypothetical protein